MLRAAIAPALLLVAFAACTAGPASPAPSSPTASAASEQPSARVTPPPGPLGSASSTPQPPVDPAVTLLVTNSAAQHVSFLDPARRDIERVEVGAAPHGLALGPEGRAYVATAEGVAIVDVRLRRRIALVPYRSRIPRIAYGEYRPGGMGIAVSPDGTRVYVGVYLPGGPSRIEVLDVARGMIVADVPVGDRPFDVLVSADGREAYAVDHDSFTVTVLNTADYSTRTFDVAPLGRGAYDKPHYGAVMPDGRLLLPVQGQQLVSLDPRTGGTSSAPLTANTHQHGVRLLPDGRFLIVGAEAAGRATRGPSLSVVDLRRQTERVIPLTRPHEHVAVSPDGRRAFLTGGYLLAGGWDGITMVDLESGAREEIAVPGLPFDIEVLP